MHERVAPEDPGKGSALNWLYAQIGIDRFDAVVVVDADTVADPDFLLGLHAAFESGATVVQGDYGVPGSRAICCRRTAVRRVGLSTSTASARASCARLLVRSVRQRDGVPHRGVR